MIHSEVEKILKNRCELSATADGVRERVGELERVLTGAPPSSAKRAHAPESPRRRNPSETAA